VARQVVSQTDTASLADIYARAQQLGFGFNCLGKILYGVLLARRKQASSVDKSVKGTLIYASGAVARKFMVFSDGMPQWDRL
jgi:hypothetical protein